MSSGYIPAALKQLVFERAGGLCEYCRSQAKYAIDPLVMEHIYPVSLGGETEENNLALSCQTCNNYKYTKTESKLLFYSTIVNSWESLSYKSQRLSKYSYSVENKSL